MAQYNRQKSKESWLVKLPTALFDLVIQFGTLSFLIFGTTMVRDENMPLYLKEGTFLLLAISYIFSVAIVGISVNERERSAVGTISSALLLSILCWMFFNGSIAIVYEVKLQGKLLALQLGITASLTALWHLLARQIMAIIRKKGKNNYLVVLVGTGKNMASLYQYMIGTKAEKGYQVMGFFTEKPEDPIPEGAIRLGTVDGLEGFLETCKPEEILCSINPALHTETVNRIALHCEQQVIRFRYVPEMEGYPPRQLETSRLGNVTVINLYEEPLNNPVAKATKRAFDLVISGLFLITLYPLVWLFCAIGIKISSPKGPILFRQKRTGYEGKEFECLKFRSMHPNTQADTLQATKEDSRTFRFGRFLRRSSLDELPQFINVFKGDMSIIGPRPHMLRHTEVYSELIGDYMVRHLAKPGITGWAQVNGCRGETKELSEMKDRVEKDIWYIEHWSVELDISIFFMTAWQILTRKGDKAY
ncbi:MAG: undecaprenyl-phosphate glucose phosphotransferase [Bacteroidales bacterium]|nr:undecaprenyl-phosphate glucose phosphotransferase [Bacteroidales bacterium]